MQIRDITSHILIITHFIHNQCIKANMWGINRNRRQKVQWSCSIITKHTTSSSYISKQKGYNTSSSKFVSANVYVQNGYKHPNYIVVCMVSCADEKLLWLSLKCSFDVFIDSVHIQLQIQICSVWWRKVKCNLQMSRSIRPIATLKRFHSFGWKCNLQWQSPAYPI